MSSLLDEVVAQRSMDMQEGRQAQQMHVRTSDKARRLLDVEAPVQYCVIWLHWDKVQLEMARRGAGLRWGSGIKQRHEKQMLKL
jgi:hypothetical protein